MFHRFSVINTAPTRQPRRQNLAKLRLDPQALDKYKSYSGFYPHKFTSDSDFQ